MSFRVADCFRRRGISIRELRFPTGHAKELLDERDPSRQWQRDEIFQKCAAAIELCFDRVNFGLLGGDHRADILHEVNSAFFALHAGALFVAARRALESHRHVATLAEARHLSHRGAAFGAGNCSLRDWRSRGIPRARRAWRFMRRGTRACRRGPSIGTRSRNSSRRSVRIRLRTFRFEFCGERNVRRDVGLFAATSSRR